MLLPQAKSVVLFKSSETRTKFLLRVLAIKNCSGQNHEVTLPVKALQNPELVVPKKSEAAFEKTHENYRTMSGVQMELETRFN